MKDPCYLMVLELGQFASVLENKYTYEPLLFSSLLAEVICETTSYKAVSNRNV